MIKWRADDLLTPEYLAWRQEQDKRRAELIRYDCPQSGKLARPLMLLDDCSVCPKCGYAVGIYEVKETVRDSRLGDWLEVAIRYHYVPHVAARTEEARAVADVMRRFNGEHE